MPKVSSNQNFEKQQQSQENKSFKGTNNQRKTTLGVTKDELSSCQRLVAKERQQLLISCNEDIHSVAEYSPMEYVSDRRQTINIHHDNSLLDWGLTSL